MNFGKTGVSVSAGVRGAHVTLGKTGTRTTVGVPGTGISYTHLTKHSPEASASSGASIPMWKVFICILIAAVLITAVLAAIGNQPHHTHDSTAFVPIILPAPESQISAIPPAHSIVAPAASEPTKPNPAPAMQPGSSSNPVQDPVAEQRRIVSSVLSKNEPVIAATPTPPPSFSYPTRGVSIIAPHSESKASTGGPVHVSGYYRKDGTYVSPHSRSR